MHLAVVVHDVGELGLIGVRGYAGGTPRGFRPHPRYADDLEIVRNAFREIERAEG